MHLHSTTFRRARYEIIDRLRAMPRLYLPAARRLRLDPTGRPKVVTPATELVVEAFPRSGSTFARVAFESAQPVPVTLAHHLHAPAQVLFAARHRIPCLVILRDPDEACISLVLRQPWLTLGQALRAYTRFHRAIVPVRGGFVLARFESVVSDFGRVVDAVNARFGTAFGRFEHTPEHAAACYAQLDAHDRALGKREGERGRPTPAREAEKRRRGTELEDPRLAAARAVARDLHRNLAEAADA